MVDAVFEQVAGMGINITEVVALAKVGRPRGCAGGDRRGLVGLGESAGRGVWQANEGQPHSRRTLSALLRGGLRATSTTHAGSCAA